MFYKTIISFHFKMSFILFFQCMILIAMLQIGRCSFVWVALLTLWGALPCSFPLIPSCSGPSIMQEEQILNLTPIGPVQVFKIHPSMNNWGCRFNMWSVDHIDRQVELICRSGRHPAHQRYILISGKNDLIAEQQISYINTCVPGVFFLCIKTLWQVAHLSLI